MSLTLTFAYASSPLKAFATFMPIGWRALRRSWTKRWAWRQFTNTWSANGVGNFNEPVKKLRLKGLPNSCDRKNAALFASTLTLGNGIAFPLCFGH
jgi:hypothetical protein